MKILAFDPSGNYKEGKGTTGICILEDGIVTKLDMIKAVDFETAEDYWAAHEDYIQREWPDHFVFESYRLYHHKGKEAKMQANSELETPQLIGFLKMACYRLKIPYSTQQASEVKSRWQEPILVHLGHLTTKGGKYYWNGKSTVTHTRDALKHALHFERYGRHKHESK